MKSNINIDNNIFLTALTGVLLFIAALGISVINILNANFQAPMVVIVCILGMSSLLMLYRAIRYDRNRVERI